MDRRTFLASGSTLLTTTTIGCLSTPGASKGREQTTTTTFRLQRITVENRSDEATLFNIDLARNGDHPYHSQQNVPAGETVTASGWTETGRTFTVVGMSKRYNNYEMVATNATDDGTGHPLEIAFVVRESGDVEGTVNSIPDE